MVGQEACVGTDVSDQQGFDGIFNGIFNNIISKSATACETAVLSFVRNPRTVATFGAITERL